MFLLALAGWTLATVLFAVLCLLAWGAVKREAEQGAYIQKLEKELRAWTGARTDYRLPRVHPVGRYGEHES